MDAWDRQPGEPPRAYHAFAHYRDAGPTRSLLVAYRGHKAACDHVAPLERHAAPKRWRLWSAAYGWVERAALWDAHIDRLGRDAAVQAQHDARARHAQLAYDGLATLTAFNAAMQEALADPAVFQALVAHLRAGPKELCAGIGLLARVAPALASLVNVERLALGMPTDRVQPVEPPARTFADRIPGDPVATELASALIDRLSQGPVRVQ